MKTQRLAKLHMAFMAVAALAACGGGGDSPAPAPAPVAVTPAPAPIAAPAPVSINFTRTLSDAWAGLGLKGVETETLNLTSDSAFYGVLTHGLTSVLGGSLPNSALTCVSNGSGSGTYNISIAKAGTYTGFRAGDSYTMTWNACKFGGSNTTRNGSTVITFNADAINTTTNSVINYKMASNNLSFSTTAGTVTSNGSLAVTYSAFSTTIDGIWDMGITALSNYTTVLSNVSSPASFVLASGSVLKNKVAAVASGYSFSTLLNGTYTIMSSSGSVPIKYLTTTNLAGIIATPSSRQIPTAGSMTIGPSAEGLVTKVDMNGSVATVTYNSNNSSSSPVTSYTSNYLTLAP